MSNPLVSIVIVNWNGEKLIAECLDSLQALEYANVEVIVVDNGSTDESLSFLRRQQGITLIQNDANYGFAKGNNIGFAIAKGKYVATLNSDIVVEPSWLNEPIRYLENDEKIGIISCRQMNYFKRDIIDGLYHYVYKTLKFDPFGIGHRYKLHPDFSNPGYVISANGGSAILRMSLVEQLGGYDERFFAYCEDADFAMRAFLNSWKCLYVPQAVVYHRGSASFGEIPKKQMFLLWRNRYYFLYKFFPISLIMKHLRWIVWNEWRTAGYILVVLKSLTLYFSIWIAILGGIGVFSLDRKRNLPLFAHKEKEFLLFLQNKILCLSKEADPL
jgi:GT2 family glycosyltransferase